MYESEIIMSVSQITCTVLVETLNPAQSNPMSEYVVPPMSFIEAVDLE